MATDEQIQTYEAGLTRLLRRLYPELQFPRRDDMYPNQDDNQQTHEIRRRWTEDEPQGFKSECKCGRKFEANGRSKRQALELHHLQNYPNNVARGI
jgi:hypothetical protein